MATYKKGYKKQNSEQVLLKVIVSIIVSVLVFIGIIFIYDAASKWRDYGHYTTITEYDGIFDYTNGGTEELQDYVVYFYSDSCENCGIAKTDVLRDGNKLNKGDDMFFIASTDTMNDADASLTAFLSEIDLSGMVTPLLIVVVDGEFYEVFTGASSVVAALDNMVDETYEAFN